MSTSQQHHGSIMNAFNGSLDNEQCEQIRLESEELYFAQRLKQAHAKVVEALRVAIQIYGKASLHLVPFYLLLIDILLREKQLKPSEEMLSLVNWLLIKNGDTLVSTAKFSEETTRHFQIRMNKLYSLLHLEYEAFLEGLQCAANGTYHCSLLFGPDHVYTSELYFCLGITFHRMQRGTLLKESRQDGQKNNELQQQIQQNDRSLAMLDKVVDIWQCFLTNPPQNLAAWKLEHRRLLQEANLMLHQIVSMRETLLGAKHITTGQVQYTLGLLLLLLQDKDQAKVFVKQAADIYVTELGSEHPSTVEVIGALRELDEIGS
ncbi:putative tetratricopeptide-like helical domain superfamily [Plasmopara halstedii]